MKKFCVDCLINSKNIDILKNLKNQNVNLSFKLFDNCIIGCKLECNNKEYYMDNVPTIRGDNDEYPILEICNKDEFKALHNGHKLDEDINFMAKGIRVEHISLIRDHIEFFGSVYKFDVISDIGIKIITSAIDIMFIMEDSSVGLIDVYMGKKLSLFNSEEEIKDQWGFKADEDEFESLKREEIQIF